MSDDRKYVCLVVEDSPLMRQLVSFALVKMKDVEVVEAESGIEGLKHLAQREFDLVITDINMPVLDGFKLIKRIRSDPDHRDVPLMVVTTEGSFEDRDNAMSLGADEYITKPVKASEMAEKVRRLLEIGKRRARK